MTLGLFSMKYQVKKYKWFAYIILGILLFLLIVLASIASIFHKKKEECKEESTILVKADSKTQKENAKEIYDFLVENYEATPQGASGVLGNLQQESQLDPSAIEREHDKLSGHGLAQWTGKRTTQLMDFAKSKDKEWDNLGLQIEFLDSELKGEEKQATKVLKETDVKKATSDWQTIFERAGKPVMENRLNYANKWFAEFGNSDPVSSKVQENATNKALEQDNKIEQLACSSEKSGNSKTDTKDGKDNLVKSAESMKGDFYYKQQHPSQDLGSDLKNPKKTGGTDCSGFVWLAMNKAGYSVPENMGWFTASMASDAKTEHKYLKEIPSSEATAGDIVIVNQGIGVGNNGHTAILLENWHGKETKIIQEGGDKTGHVNEGEFDTSFSSLLENGTIIFAQSIDSQEDNK